MRHNHILDVIIILLVLVSFGMAFYFYQALPDKIATHWNADGIADGFGGKDIGLFLIPIIGIFIIILFVFLPRIDPLKSKVGDYSPLMKKIGILALTFLVYLHGAIIYSNLRYKFSMTSAIAPGFAFLFIGIGFFLKKTKRNWFLGIRTHWTMSSDTVWQKTHALGSKLFILSGALTLLGLIFPVMAFWFMILPIITSIMILFVYSYLEYKKNPQTAT